MGAFGFLSGPKFASQGGQPNLGLYDQRLALEWVKNNIDKFGGDANQLTLMGESAGAGSIVHQLVWDKDAKGPNATFQKAILQSPAWVPIAGGEEGNKWQDRTYERFLELLDVKDLAGARGKNELEIVAASRQLVWEAPHGKYFSFSEVLQN